MSSPPRPAARRVGLDGNQLVTGLIYTVRDRDDSQQLGGLGTLPTTHTGAYRRRAAYHCESLPCCLRVGRAVVASATGRGRALHIGVVRTDVDPPSGQPGGEPGILPFPPDRQGELVVRHCHPGGTGGQVNDLDTERLGG